MMGLYPNQPRSILCDRQRFEFGKIKSKYGKAAKSKQIGVGLNGPMTAKTFF